MFESCCFMVFIVSVWNQSRAWSLQLLCPHIFVWGSCFWLGTPALTPSSSFLPPPPLPPPHTQLPHTPLAHTQLVHTHNLLPHTTYFHTQLTHTQLPCTQRPHTQLTHTHNLLSHNFLTRNFITHNLSTQLTLTQLTHTHNLSTHNFLSHTQLPHTTYSHTQLPHTHTTYSHTTCPHTTYSHTTSSHTQLTLTQLLHTQATHTHNLFTNFARQAFALMALDWLWWRAWAPFGAVVLAISTFTLHGRRGTWRHRPPLCVAGVALGDIDRHFAWQAWHLVTSTVTLRGRRGTYGTGLALVARLGPVWRRGCRGCLRGRCGAWRHRPSLCVAGVALGDIDIRVVDVWPDLPGTSAKLVLALQPFAFAKHLSALMTVCADCSATLRMVSRPAVAIHLYSWCWYAGFGYMITHHLSTTLVHTTFYTQYVLTPHLYTQICPTQLFHTQFFDTLLPTQYLFTQTHLHTYIHAYIHTYMHTYIRTYVHTYIRTYVHTCMHAYIHPSIRMHACMLAYIHTNMHTYIHMYVRTYVPTYLHTYIHTYARIHMHTHTAHAFRWPHNAHIHTCIHIHTHFHARFYHTHTYTPLLHTIAYTPFTHLPSTYFFCARQSFTISFLFPAFPIPSSPFSGCLLEEVDMWGYPALYFSNTDVLRCGSPSGLGGKGLLAPSGADWCFVTAAPVPGRGHETSWDAWRCHKLHWVVAGKYIQTYPNDFRGVFRSHRQSFNLHTDSCS